MWLDGLCWGMCFFAELAEKSFVIPRGKDRMLKDINDDGKIVFYTAAALLELIGWTKILSQIPSIYVWK